MLIFLFSVTFFAKTGYATEDTFIVSCPGRSGYHGDLTYQITSRFPGHGIGAEKQIEETDSIEQGVELNLPVGNLNDNYTLEVVVRAVDGVGGYDESISLVKVGIFQRIVPTT